MQLTGTTNVVEDSRYQAKPSCVHVVYTQVIRPHLSFSISNVQINQSINQSTNDLLTRILMRQVRETIVLSNESAIETFVMSAASTHQQAARAYMDGKLNFH